LEKNNTPIRPKYNNRFRSRIGNEIIFIAFVTFGLVWLVALITHSSTENPWSGSVALGESVINLAGIVGAYLSDISLSILGYGAYVIPLSLMWLGYKIHKNRHQPLSSFAMMGLRFFTVMTLIASFSTLLSQFSIGEGPAGGWIGELLHGHFGALFGSISAVVYLCVIMISLSIAAGISWIKILNAVFTGIGVWLHKFKESRIRVKQNRIKKIKPSRVKPNKRIKPTSSGSNLFKNKTLGGLPDLSLLDEINSDPRGYSKKEIEDMSRRVEEKLKDFGFDVTVTAVTPGPVVTQFEMSLAAGVKVSQIMNLSKDLARALLVEGVRIVDVIPGKPVIGLEIPNSEREMIGLKEILSADVFTRSSSMLTIALGKDINGHPVVANLAKMPHLLVAGATGMGKSVGLNAMILSVLYKATPEQVRMIMIDPKIVELSCYADVPHLLTPVITDMNQAASALWWCVNEMERRYLLLAKFGVRNIDGFNEKLKSTKQKGKPLLDPSFNKATAEEGETAPELEPLPLIMLVIDEFADMLGALAQEDRTKAKRVEALIIRLAQKARASGIHLIIATQRPSVDVITGLIKSNVPSRVAFKVASKVDSRTVLDQGGAEQLLGMGDMLYMTPGISHLTRVHGAFVDDDEIARVVGFLREHSETNYLNSVVNAHSESAESHESTASQGEADKLYDEAVQIVTSSRRASISSLQRRLRIGYNRAARIIEDMEATGVVSSMNSAGNRQVLAPEPISND
jgi:S-DNA-T family DNA segregation ATPase FtsK/SpoIIIE